MSAVGPGMNPYQPGPRTPISLTPDAPQVPGGPPAPGTAMKFGKTDCEPCERCEAPGFAPDASAAEFMPSAGPGSGATLAPPLPYIPGVTAPPTQAAAAPTPSPVFRTPNPLAIGAAPFPGMEEPELTGPAPGAGLPTAPPPRPAAPPPAMNVGALKFGFSGPPGGGQGGGLPPELLQLLAQGGGQNGPALGAGQGVSGQGAGGPGPDPSFEQMLRELGGGGSTPGGSSPAPAPGGSQSTPWGSSVPNATTSIYPETPLITSSYNPTRPPTPSTPSNTTLPNEQIGPWTAPFPSSAPQVLLPPVSSPDPSQISFPGMDPTQIALPSTPPATTLPTGGLPTWSPYSPVPPTTPQIFNPGSGNQKSFPLPIGGGQFNQVI